MKITVWSKSECQQCDTAKALLESKNLPYEERIIGDMWTREDLLKAVPTARSVPQIFVNGDHVGGLAGLTAHLSKASNA